MIMIKKYLKKDYVYIYIYIYIYIFPEERKEIIDNPGINILV